MKAVATTLKQVSIFRCLSTACHNSPLNKNIKNDMIYSDHNYRM